MQIGQVAERTGLSLRTIRWYEEEGLVGPTTRTGGSTVDVVYDSGFGANPAASVTR